MAPHESGCLKGTQVTNNRTGSTPEASRVSLEKSWARMTPLLACVFSLSRRLKLQEEADRMFVLEKLENPLNLASPTSSSRPDEA